MDNIDSRVVSLRFDNSNFERNTRQTLNTLNRLRTSLSFFSTGNRLLGNLSEEAEQVNLSPLQQGVESLKTKFSALEIVGITALVNITNSAVNAGKRIASALTIQPITTGFQEYETQINAIQTILANTESKGTTLQDVNNALNELNKYADLTIYNFTEMTRNIGTFTAAGVDLKTSVSAIKGIANLAAVSGSTSLQASTAMYQLSQAIAAGTVKLMDWNSVVNAGMGGQVFQDALKETARVHGIAIDDMIKKEGSFRETLQNGWLSTEILLETLNKFTGDLTESQLKSMGYTDQQIASIIKMGQTANNAATKVKTVTQLWDTLREAAQSGWTQTWQIIIGDFGEAKGFLTEVSDMVSNLLNDTANARNELLTSGLSTGWKQLINEGINDEQEFQKIIEETAKTHNINTEQMIKDAGSFEKSLKNGWLTSEIVQESIQRYTDKINKMSSEELLNAGYTRSQIEELNKFNDAIKNGSVNLSEFTEKFKMDSGRENLIQSLRNVAQSIMNIVTPIKEAFREVFPKTTGDQIYNITKNIRDFTDGLKLSEENMSRLKTTFQGLFSVIKIFTDVAGVIISTVFKGIEVGGSPVITTLLKITSVIGEALIALTNFINKYQIFGNIIHVASDVIVYCFELVSSVLGDLSIKTSDGSVKIVDGLSKIGSTIKELASTVVKSGLGSLLQGLIDVVQVLGKSLMDTLGKIDFESLTSIISGIAIGNIGITINKLLRNITGNISENSVGIIDRIKSGIESLGEMFNSLKGILVSFQNQIKSKIIINIAKSVAIMAGSLLVLSMIDKEKLAIASGALVSLLTELIGAMKIYTSFIGGNLKQVVAASTLIGTMTKSLLIMSGVMIILSTMDWQGLAKGITGMTVMMGSLVLYCKLIGDSSKNVRKGALSMIVLGTALIAMAKACKRFGSLSWNSLIKGLVGTLAVLMSFSLFTRTIGSSKGIIKSALSITILAESLLILSDSMIKMAKISWEGLAKSMSSVLALLLSFSLFNRIKGNSKSLLRTSASILMLSEAMNILGDALIKMAKISWEGLGKSISGITSLSILFTVFGKINNSSKGLLTTSISITILSEAMKTIADTMTIISKISWEGLGKVASSIGVVLLELGLLMRLIPKDMIINSIGLITVAYALTELSKSLTLFGSMSWESIEKSLIVLSAGLLSLGVALRVMRSSVSGAAAMIIAASAISVITPCLKTLGKMNIKQIGLSLLALAGAFTVLGVAGRLLQPVSLTLLAVSASMLVISSSLVVLGAGITSIGIGIVSLATSFKQTLKILSDTLPLIINSASDLVKAVSILIDSTCEALISTTPQLLKTAEVLIMGALDLLVLIIPKMSDKIIEITLKVLKVVSDNAQPLLESLLNLFVNVMKALANKIPEVLTSSVNVLGVIVKTMCDMIDKLEPENVAKIIVSFGALATFFKIIGAMRTTLKRAIVSLLLMDVAIAALGGAIALISLIPIDTTTKICSSLSKMLVAMSASLAIISLIPIQSAVQGLGSFGIFVLGLTAILAALGGIKQIPGVTWIIEEGSSFLSTLGMTIGDFIGSIIGGIGAGMSSALPEIGNNLTLFMNNIQGFLFGCNNINQDTMKSIESLCNAILTLTKAEILNAVSSFISGSQDFADFATKITFLADGITAFSDRVKGKVDKEALDSAAYACDLLTKLADSIPRSGGLWGAIAGNKDIGDFAEKLPKLGTGLSMFVSNVKGKVDKESVETAVNACDLLVKMADSLPRSGGLWGAIAGNKDLELFGNNLVILGRGIAGFTKEVKGIVTKEAVDAALIVGETLASISSTIPESGGLWGILAGDNDLSDFADCLVKLGTSVSVYATTIEPINTEILSKVTNAIIQLSIMADNLQATDYSGVKQFNLVIPELGKTIINFNDTITNLNMKLPMSCNNTLETIKKMINDIGQVKTFQVQNFINDMDNLNKITLTNFASSVQNGSSKIIESFRNLFNTMQFVIDSKRDSIIKSYDGIIKGCIDTVNGYGTRFISAGSHLSESLSNGLKSKIGKISSAYTSCLNSAIISIRDYRSHFWSAGQYLAEGLADGMNANRYKVISAAKSMANAAAEGARRALDIHSPSKVFYSIGDYASKGFIKALSDSCHNVDIQGKRLGEVATASLQNSLQTIYDKFQNGTKSPVITPVIDSRNVKFGMNQINNMFGNRQLSAVASYNMASSIDVGKQTDNVDEIKRSVDKLINAIDIKHEQNNNAKYVINTELTIDKTRIAKATAEATQQELNRLTKIQNRKAGIK